METLGQDTFSCPVVDLSHYTFDWDRFLSVMEPYYFEDLVKEIKTVKFDIVDQVKTYGYKIESSTLEWWKSQGPEAREKIKPSSSDMKLVDGVDQWLTTIPSSVKYWWTRSNTFDPVIAWRICRDTGYGQVYLDKLKFWNVRDTRTWIDSKFDFPKLNGFCPFTDEEAWKKVFHAHDSAHDVAAEIMRFQAIARAEAGLDHINR